MSLFLNTLRPKKWTPFRRRHFQVHFLEWNVWILIKISMKFVPKGPMNNIPALVQIMAWCRPGNKPLSELMMVSLTTHICVTRLPCVNHPQHMKHTSLITLIRLSSSSSYLTWVIFGHTVCITSATNWPQNHRSQKLRQNPKHIVHGCGQKSLY